MKFKLADLCDYAREKITIEEVDERNYISTENLLPNKNGVTVASSVPNVKYAKFFKVGDVLVSNIRPYFRKIWYATFEGGCSNDVLVFRSKSTVRSRFLYYVLADDKFFDYATATSKGTKMPRGDIKAIMEYSVPDIPHDAQIKIADLLSVLDDKIERNIAINKNLEEQAQSLYNELFHVKNNDSTTKVTLDSLGTIVGGSTPSKKHPEYYSNKGIAWITPKDLSNNASKFISRGATDISELGLLKCSVFIMPTGSVLFSSRAPIGYTAIAANPISTNQGFKSVIPNEDIGAAFIYYFLKSNLNLIENMASGSTFKEISTSTMRKIPAFLPNATDLQLFQHFCEPLFTYQYSLEQENIHLIYLRDTLLPRLMSGELDVSNIEL